MKELKELFSQRKYIFKKEAAHRQTGHGGKAVCLEKEPEGRE